MKKEFSTIASLVEKKKINSIKQKSSFYKKILQRLVDNSNSEGPAIIVGFPREEKGRIYNSAVLIEKGNSYIIDKFHLPNYGVFDEE